MRKWLVMFLATIAAALVVPTAIAEEAAATADTNADQRFVVTGQLRLRWERLENYFDFDDHTDDAFSFFPYRARVGVLGHLADNVDVVMEIQNFGSFGDESPNQSFFFPPLQNFDGSGASNGTRSSETSIYQAAVTLNKIGGTNFGARLGRQEYEFGDGLILGNEDYYNGTVFDGVRAWYDFDKWSVNGFYFVTTERNDLSQIGFTGAGSDDQHMEGIVGSWHPEFWGKCHIDGYVVNWQDGFEGVGKPQFWTYGGHWWRSVATKEDAEAQHFDWNVEIAFQSGQGTDPTTEADFDLGGDIEDLGIGYNFVAGNTVHRVHAGYLRQSGDDDLTDNDFKGWNVLFPRTHGRFGDADFFGSNFGGNISLFIFPPTGITAMNLGYEMNARDGRHRLAATAWWFQPSEDKVKGFDANDDGVDDKIESLATEFDVSYAYQYSKHVSLSAGLAWLMPGDGLTFNNVNGVNNTDDSVTRYTMAATVKF